MLFTFLEQVGKIKIIAVKMYQVCVGQTKGKEII